MSIEQSHRQFNEVHCWRTEGQMRGYPTKYIDKIYTDYSRLSKILKQTDNWVNILPLDVVVNLITTMDVSKNTISKYFKVLFELRDENNGKECFNELYKLFASEYAKELYDKQVKKKYEQYLEDYAFGQKYGIYSTRLKDYQSKHLKPYIRKTKKLSK